MIEVSFKVHPKIYKKLAKIAEEENKDVSDFFRDLMVLYLISDGFVSVDDPEVAKIIKDGKLEKYLEEMKNRSNSEDEEES